jgi:hypothetical protein
VVGFNIQNQNAGVINNVEGNQRIEGGQHGTLVTLDDARSAADDLRHVIVQNSVAGGSTEEAAANVEQIKTELRKAQPDRHVVADLVMRLTRLLASVGSLVAAGSPLLAPLHILASWLGGLGAPILAMLP